jgi:hypothetical protein
MANWGERGGGESQKLEEELDGGNEWKKMCVKNVDDSNQPTWQATTITVTGQLWLNEVVVPFPLPNQNGNSQSPQ